MKNFRKILSWILIFALIFGQLSAPITVLAQEATASAQPTPEATNSATPADPTPAPTPTPSAAPIEATPSAQPTATPSAQPVNTPSPPDEQVSRAENQKKIIKREKTPKINQQKNYIEGEVLVKLKTSKVNLKTNQGLDKLAALEDRHNAETITEIEQPNIAVLQSDKTTEGLVEQLKKDPEVDRVEPNYIYTINSIPNDPKFTDLWGLENNGQTVNGITGKADADIDAPEAWDLENDNQADAIVAVIDTGVAYNHPDLTSNMWDGTNCKDDNNNVILGGCPNHGWDYQANDNSPDDDYGHGTHVAGTIAGISGNGVGISGVSSKNNLKIMALKVNFPRSNSFSLDAIIQSIYFAKNNEAKVINASFGGGPYSQLLKDAIAAFPGLFVAAAGNGGSDYIGDNNDASPHYPSSYDNPNIVAVAATTQDDTLTPFSNYGATSVDVGAPGSNIFSTVSTFIINEVYFENFESLTPPAVPNGYTKIGDWGTKVVDNSGSSTDGGGSDIALYGDINTPYKPNANSTIASPKLDLLNNTSAFIGFRTRCDTQYEGGYTDYMKLEFSKDGQSFEGYDRWDEYDLDTINEAPHDPTGYAESYLEYEIPSQYLTKNFKFQFRWISNGSITGDLGLGCFIDVISINVEHNSFRYDYYNGTSMATPHVAGQAAMLLSYRPDLTSTQVKDIILNSGDPLPTLQGKTVSGKRINLNNALRSNTQSSNANLSNLTVNQGTLTPNFSPSITTYAVSVGNHISSITVTPTAEDTKSTIKVNSVVVASGAASSPINLNVGNNTIATLVTAESGATKTYTINVSRANDITAPTITITKSPNKNIHNAPYTITVHFDDAVTKKYKIDSGNLTDYTQAVTVSSEGQHTFYAEGTDSAGNKGTAQISFEVDLTAPSVTITKNPDKSLSNGSYILTVSYSDATTKEYRINSGNWLTYTGEVTVENDGSYTFEARGTDLAGNTNTSQTSFTIDKTKPVITINSPAVNARVSGISILQFSVNEQAEVKCSFDNLTFKSCSSDKTFADLDGFNTLPEGSFTLSIQAQDTATNIQTVSRSFIKDTHMPSSPGTPTAQAGPMINAQEYASGFLVVVPLAQDAETGDLLKVYLNTDYQFISHPLTQQDINSTQYSFAVGSPSLGEDGTKQFKAQITDDLGRTSPLSNPLTLTLDTLAPTLTYVSIRSSNPSPTKAKVGDTIALQFRTSEGLGKDPQVSISESIVSVSQTNNTYTASRIIQATDQEMVTIFEINFEDGAGNKGEKVNSTTDQTSVTIDKTAPQVVISKTPNKYIANTDYVIEINFDDATVKEYRLDTNNWAEYLGPITVSIKGLHVINARGTDAAGNSADAEQISFIIDKTAPAVSGVEDGKFYNVSITPNFNEGSAKLNRVDFSSGTEISQEGSYTLVVTDEASNTTTVNFVIDTTAPLLNMIRVPDVEMANSNYTLAIEYADTNLNSKEYRLDGGNWTDYSQPLIVTGEGNHTFEARVTDKALNITLKQTNFRINKTVPQAVNDTYTAIKNTPITIDSAGLLANDTDLGGDTLSITGYSNAENGQVEITGSGVTFRPVDNFIGTAKFTYTVSDGLNTTTGWVYVVITPNVNNNQIVIQPILDLSQDKTSVVIVNVPFDTVINVPSSASNATLNLSNLITSTATGTSTSIVSKINVNAATSIGNVSLQIPSSITILGPASWTGIINAPQVQSNASATPPAETNKIVTTVSVIEVGAADLALTFDKAVRILVPGQAGKLVGFQRGTFTKITAICDADTQATENSLGAGAECYINIGSDLVIWTKHFTKFVTYTETPVSNSGSSSNNSSGSSSGSGSSNSGASICTDVKPGSAPKLLSAVLSGANEVTLTWNKAADPVTYYLVAYGLEKGKVAYGNPNVGGKDTTIYKVKGLSGSTTYYFKVRAGNHCMPGEFSNELAATAYGGTNIKPAEGFNKGVLSTNKGDGLKKVDSIKPSNNILEVIRNFILKLFSNLRSTSYLLPANYVPRPGLRG